MSAFLKYGIVMATGLAVGLWISEPMSLQLAAKLARFDEASVVNDAHATATSIDLAAPSRVDEDLDYLVAKRIGTLEAWQAFLAAHSVGEYAESASSEIDKLMLRAKASEATAAEVSEANPANEAVSQPNGAPTPTVEPDPSAEVDQSPGPRPRPTAAALDRDSAVASHNVPIRRELPCVIGFRCHWSARALPPLLQALLGVRTKHSARAYRQMADADAGAGGIRSR